MSNNQEWLQKRLAECEAKAKAASDEGDYAQFQKWDFEANNIKALIKMNEGVIE
jgi:hypothetical protein